MLRRSTDSPTYLLTQRETPPRGARRAVSVWRCVGWVQSSGLGGAPLPCVSDAEALRHLPLFLSHSLSLSSTRAVGAASRNDPLPSPLSSFAFSYSVSPTVSSLIVDSPHLSLYFGLLRRRLAFIYIEDWGAPIVNDWLPRVNAVV